MILPKIKLRKNEEGFVMVLALFIVLILSLLVTTSLTTYASWYKIKDNMDNKNQSYYVADAAYAWLIWQYKINGGTKGYFDNLKTTRHLLDTELEGLGTADIIPISDSNGNKYHIKIIGKYKSVESTLDLQIKVMGSSGKLQTRNWTY